MVVIMVVNIQLVGILLLVLPPLQAPPNTEVDGHHDNNQGASQHRITQNENLALLGQFKAPANTTSLAMSQLHSLQKAP